MANRICSVCSAELGEDIKFCTACGAPVQVTNVEEAPKPLAYEEAATSAPSAEIAPPPLAIHQDHQPQQQPILKPAAEEDFIPPKGSKYEPISTRGYFGIWLLMLVPFLNLILLIVWACGGCRKVNKRNYARATIIAWVIVLILGVILTFVFRNVLNSYLAPIMTPNLAPYISN